MTMFAVAAVAAGVAAAVAASVVLASLLFLHIVGVVCLYHLLMKH